MKDLTLVAYQAQFEGGFADASSEFVPIEDTEPKYMRGLLQFIFTRYKLVHLGPNDIQLNALIVIYRFLPLLSLRQAFLRLVQGLVSMNLLHTLFQKRWADYVRLVEMVNQTL